MFSADFMRRRRFTLPVLLGISMVFALQTRAAWAIDPVAHALKLQGDAAMDAGRFGEALANYTQALGVEATPALHYNRGRALQALGRFAEALAEVEAFQATATPDLLAAVPRLDELLGSLGAKVAYLVVRTDAKDATIRIERNGIITPFVQPYSRLDAGRHVVIVEAPNREAAAVTVDLVEGEKRAIDVSLKMRDETGLLHVRSDVAGANVYLDQIPVGAVPLDLRVAPGAHAIEAVHPSYRKLKTSVIIEPRVERELILELDPIPAWYESRWLWAGLGLFLVSGTAGYVAWNTERDADRGDIPPGQLRGP